ncbi:NRDE family protein [Bacillus sp. OTU2372]|uniref:NRDE family protein n=1 Tax=Bacillus sp. OTU2372 TaxID=3043858 RepID=UPI00313C1A9D
MKWEGYLVLVFLIRVVIFVCLILFAYRVHKEYQLIVAANRDEFYRRPTAPAYFWEDHPEILAGRDLEKMGTWMGVTTSGRFAALTNYRDPKEATEGKRSRGELVADALKYKGNMEEYMQNLEAHNHLYPGYNLLAGDGHDLYYYSNVGGKLEKLAPGIYGVSNHLLNSSWPKVEKGREGLARIISEKNDGMAEALFTLLQNADPAPDEALPSTGVTLEWERLLSPLFIESEHYGTRSSTVMLMTGTKLQYIERVFSKNGENNQQYTIEL